MKVVILLKVECSSRALTESTLSVISIVVLNFSVLLRVETARGNTKTKWRQQTMAVISMKQLLEGGVHFGHQTRRRNPKMKKYIFTEETESLHHRFTKNS